jgi:hypothetical protein
MEKGQYKRRSGSNTRTVSFSEPVRAIVLFEKRVAEIAARAPVEAAFPDTFCFAPVFESLYPPNMVSKTHGVDLHWEIQLLHDEFVDQEIVGSLAGLNKEAFTLVESESRLSAPSPANF